MRIDLMPLQGVFPTGDEWYDVFLIMRPLEIMNPSRDRFELYGRTLLNSSQQERLSLVERRKLVLMESAGRKATQSGRRYEIKFECPERPRLYMTFRRDSEDEAETHKALSPLTQQLSRAVLQENEVLIAHFTLEALKHRVQVLVLVWLGSTIPLPPMLRLILVERAPSDLPQIVGFGLGASLKLETASS